jgi:hypothetical protein
MGFEAGQKTGQIFKPVLLGKTGLGNNLLAPQENIALEPGMKQQELERGKREPGMQF